LLGKDAQDTLIGHGKGGMGLAMTSTARGGTAMGKVVGYMADRPRWEVRQVEGGGWWCSGSANIP